MRGAKRLVLLSVLALCAPAGCGPEPSSAPDLLLISVDTLRADHLGSYGHPLPTSPRLDEIAASGVRFEQALATAPWTLPSHASLLTGRHVVSHGVQTLDDALPEGVVTLAAHLAERGYVTAAVTNNLFLSHRFGLLRGFHHTTVVPSDQAGEGAAERVADQGLAYVASLEARGIPWFLFLHFFDVHSDYRSLPDLERRFVQRRSPDDGTSDQLRRINEGDLPLTPERAEYLSRLYDAGIRQLDDRLARLFGGLGRKGWLDGTVVVVTSDHGDEFGEHGGVAHGHTQYGEMLRVPLLVSGPGVPAGRRVAEPVSLVDVVPTVLDLLGIGPLEGVDGRSLRPLWESGPEGGPSEALFAGAAPAMRGDSLAAVRVERYKLVRDADAGRRELYDVRTDPGETRNLAEELPEVARRLEARLDAHLARRVEGDRSPELEPAARERLRALGYVLDDEPARR